MHRLPPKYALSVWLLLAASGSGAEVFRWVDEQGQVHYEDRSQAQSVGGARSYRSPSAAADEPQQRMEKTRRLLDAYQAERQQAREQKDQQKQAQAQRNRRCAVARDNLRQYQEYGAIYRLGEDGERIYLSEQERETLLQRSRADVDKWCS